MRKWLIGCGVLFGVVLVLCIGVLVWAVTPPKIEIPPRQLPPNNAYHEYRANGGGRCDERLDARRAVQADRGVPMLRNRQPLSAADRAYYLQRMEPYLRRYERLVQRPSVVSAERSAETPFPELSAMRRIARAEAYLMREELRQKRYRAAIARADRLSRLRRSSAQRRTANPLLGRRCYSLHRLAADSRGVAAHSRPRRAGSPAETRPRLRKTAHASVEVHAGGILLRAERPPRYCRRAHTTTAKLASNDAQRGEKTRETRTAYQVASWSKPHCQNITA
jgi:hypothetical protein